MVGLVGKMGGSLVEDDSIRSGYSQTSSELGLVDWGRDWFGVGLNKGCGEGLVVEGWLNWSLMRLRLWWFGCNGIRQTRLVIDEHGGIDDDLDRLD